MIGKIWKTTINTPDTSNLLKRDISDEELTKWLKTNGIPHPLLGNMKKLKDYWDKKWNEHKL